MILSVEKSIAMENELKTNFGYSGCALSKSHYNGDESCLTAYTKLVVNGYIVLVRQFSDFFAYYVVKEESIEIKQFFFENGVSKGYFVVANGVNWAVQETKELALSWYNRLNGTNYNLFNFA